MARTGYQWYRGLTDIQRRESILFTHQLECSILVQSVKPGRQLFKGMTSIISIARRFTMSATQDCNGCEPANMDCDIRPKSGSIHAPHTALNHEHAKHLPKMCIHRNNTTLEGPLVHSQTGFISFTIRHLKSVQCYPCVEASLSSISAKCRSNPFC